MISSALAQSLWLPVDQIKSGVKIKSLWRFVHRNQLARRLHFSMILQAGIFIDDISVICCQLQIFLTP